MSQAAGSQAYGQLLDKMPGVRSQYDNQNVQITNQFRQLNNQTRNNESAVNMQNDQNYWRESVQGQVNFDNMRRYLSDQAMSERFAQAETNQSLAYRLLTQNQPAYAFDWKSGNFMRNKKDVRDVENSPQGDYLDKLFSSIKFEDLTTEQKIQYIRELQRGKALQYMNPQFGQTPPPFKKGGKVKNPWK
jgi:hypothetical protein